MVISDTNRGAYFSLELQLPNFYEFETETIKNKIETNIDLVLAGIGATKKCYKFTSDKERKVLYLFKTSNRKRKGQLNKLIEKYLKNIELIDYYATTSLLKSEFNALLNKTYKEKSYKIEEEPSDFDGYNAEDLEIFKNKENWFDWQNKLYSELFYEHGQVKPANPRQIIALYDEKGNSGKSSFFKYLYYNHSDDIGRITYGSSSQLRSCIINIGRKKIYVVDLTRSKGKTDSEADLLSAIEDLKNGFVSSSMYGGGITLLMNIPHVVVSSNFIFDQNSLSEDRWKIYEIKNRKLEDITFQLKKKNLKNKEDKEQK